jgi:hypothetical protein
LPRFYIPRRVDEADYVGKESTIHWINDSHLSQRLHGTQQHNANDQIADDLPFSCVSKKMFISTLQRFDGSAYQTSWSTSGQSTTCTNKKTCSNSAAFGTN